MKAYAEQGEIALAKKQFETCRQLLEKELGVPPAQETRDLLSRLMRDAPVDAPTPIPAREAAAKPSLAVLPFTMLSADPSQRYFSDGITQDIITELSRFRQLRVHAHHIAGKDDKDPVSIGRALGVQYLVEGSVRRIGERIRINTQLIEVDTGQTIWAERFDRDQEEIFSVQDQVVRTIVGTLVGRVKSAGVERASRKPPASLAAYECVLRADAFPIGVPEAEAEARLLYQKAIALDPGYARAYMLLANSLTLEWYRDMRAASQLLDQALELAQKALQLDENDELCQTMVGRTHMLRRTYDLAEYHHMKALELNPNSVLLMTDLGILYGFLGEPERGIEYFKEAKRLDPLFEPTWYWRNRAIVHFIGREYGEAIAALNRSPIMPDWVHAFLAASYAHLDSMDKAKFHASKVLRLSPDFSVDLFSGKDPFKRPEDRQHLADGLRKAGLPE
jgi:TolB-like protein/Tfp pilus assembly protein PilF